ncbi:MAG: HEPN domain-containing protein [Anaerolineae bacterium]
MNSSEDAAYRLQLARECLSEAEEDLNLKRWRPCVDGAQLAIENAAKAIVACFGPVPRTHELGERLQVISTLDRAKDVAAKIEPIIPLVVEYGTQMHIRVTYGDEKTFRTPRMLFGEGDAVKAAANARQVVAVAERVYEHFF